MYGTRHFAAGIVAALVVAPGVAAAQAPTSGATRSEQAAPAQTASASAQSAPAQPASGSESEVRQHLTAARQSLAELTKLPAATALQGDQRTQVATFIQQFNDFATAATDWKAKYETVDQTLDQLTGANGTAPAGLDPTITAKLQEVRGHLDAFELATGDPAFIADRIEQVLENAGSKTAGDAAAAAPASGSAVTLDQAQVEEIRKQLDRLRQSGKK